jgi:hypothetical protein
VLSSIQDGNIRRKPVQPGVLLGELDLERLEVGVATSNPDAALNFGLEEHLEHDERYRHTWISGLALSGPSCPWSLADAPHREGLMTIADGKTRGVVWVAGIGSSAGLGAAVARRFAKEGLVGSAFAASNCAISCRVLCSVARPSDSRPCDR